MKTASVETVIKALNAASVRYVIAGGLAVVAHGYVRFTADIDLMVALDDANLAKAIGVFRQLSYAPRAPVPLDAVLDEQTRMAWIQQKGMMVFSLHSDAHPATEIDVFLDLPLDFEQAYARSALSELLPGVAARFCSLDDLIAMKMKAGRPRDFEDVRQLQRLKEPDDA